MQNSRLTKGVQEWDGSYPSYQKLSFRDKVSMPVSTDAHYGTSAPSPAGEVLWNGIKRDVAIVGWNE